jgi:hypothetical protein
MQTLYYYNDYLYFTHMECGENLDTNNATDQEPAFSPGYRAKWAGTEWEFEEVPASPPEPTPVDKVAELEAGLTELDLRSTRALRAIAAGTGTQDDHDKLAEFETAAQGLRQQLQELLT